jgi:hypothetical protein
LCQASTFTRDHSFEIQPECWINHGVVLKGKDSALLEYGIFDAIYRMIGMAIATRHHAEEHETETVEPLKTTIR